MMNILQQQEALKDMSESQLVQEAKRPSGSVPSYMVLSELNRREDMRQRYKLNQPKPTSTVAEEVIAQTEQGLGSMMPRRQPQQMGARSQMPMQQSAIAQNQPMRMNAGGKVKELEDRIAQGLDTMSDEELSHAYNFMNALNNRRGSIEWDDLQANNSILEQLDAEIYQKRGLDAGDVEAFGNPYTPSTRAQRTGSNQSEEQGGGISDYLIKNLANPFAGFYDTVIGLPAAVVQNATEFVGSSISDKEPNYVTSTPAQEALFGATPSIKIEGRDNATKISPRGVGLALEKLKAEKAAALIEGAEAGRVGGTNANPQATQEEADDTINQILEKDPSLDRYPIMPTNRVKQFYGSNAVVDGISAPTNFEVTPARAVNAPTDYEYNASIINSMPTDYEYEASPINNMTTDEASGTGGNGTGGDNNRGASGLPLPLLLEAARFGADLADRGTRGEGLLGSVAGAGKTSIDRGLAFAERQISQQQAQQLANAKREQDFEDFKRKENYKDLFKEDKDPVSVSDIKAVYGVKLEALQNLRNQTPPATPLDIDQAERELEDIRQRLYEMIGSGVGVSGTQAQNVAKAQQILASRNPSS
jgi:hypothetical protein